ncbi:MAG: guanylate kinase [Balneolaceae bacterium]|nr:guanylate kinase [Balneolaceae bacterium]
MSIERGKIIILVSPSGGGKSTMKKRLIEDFDQLQFSVSATTRAPREGERDGVDYYFLDRREFNEKIQKKEFLEWEVFYNGTMYGTLRSVVENDLNKGYFVLLDIDVLGAKNVKQMYGPEALAIFLSPPSIQVLKERLLARGTEDPESLQTRLERAENEMAYANEFDVNIVNDDLDKAYAKIRKTVSTFINS